MSTSKCLDMHLLHMESLGFFNPFINSGRDGGHGEDHSGNLLINSQRELIDEGNVVHDSSLAGKVLEVCDVLLEIIIGGSIGEASGFLDKFREIKASSGLGVEGVESGFEIFYEFVEGFLKGVDGGVCHFVIPHFSKGGAPSFTHFVESGHDLVIVRGVEGGVDSKVGFDGLDPSGGIR